MIIVYTKPACVQCQMTKKALDRADLEYREVNLEEQPEYIDQVKRLGFRSVPVVQTEADAWSGFQPDIINVLKRKEQK